MIPVTTIAFTSIITNTSGSPATGRYRFVIHSAIGDVVLPWQDLSRGLPVRPQLFLLASLAAEGPPEVWNHGLVNQTVPPLDPNRGFVAGDKFNAYVRIDRVTLAHLSPPEPIAAGASVRVDVQVQLRSPSGVTASIETDPPATFSASTPERGAIVTRTNHERRPPVLDSIQGMNP